MAQMVTAPRLMLLTIAVMLRSHTHYGRRKYVSTVMVVPSYARLIMVMLDLHHSALR